MGSGEEAAGVEGLAAAAAEAVARALSPQLELLGAAPTARLAAVAMRRAGRPPGARSRRFEETARAVIERFGDPLLRQVAIATMPLEELMALGLDVGQALAEQRLAAAVVLPYLHQRQAVAVDVTTHRTVNLTIVTGLAEDDGEAAPAIVGYVTNQEVSDGGAAVVARPTVARPGQGTDDAG